MVPQSGLDVDAGVIDAGVINEWQGITTDDRAARYLAWMGLGGTQANIPASILSIVSNTSIFGVSPQIPSSAISANMLAVAKATCFSIVSPPGLPAQGGVKITVPSWYTTAPGGEFIAGNPGLIAQNGHAELWLKLCSLQNPPPVRAVDALGQIYSYGDLFPQSVYPAGAPVGNDRGGTDNGVLPSNLFPWCLRGRFVTQTVNGVTTKADPSWPICPDVIDHGPLQTGDDTAAATAHAQADGALNLSSGHACTNGCWGSDSGTNPPVDDGAIWATRGAINAAFSVFIYLNTVANDPSQRLPDYTACASLGGDGGASP